LRPPTSRARHLLEHGAHVLLVGGGAMLYAREHGFAADSPESMIAPRAKARFDAGERPDPSGGTVGACAIDAAGRLAAATSTGGTVGKRPGRVGDTPLIGGGTYADEEGGAA